MSLEKNLGWLACLALACLDPSEAGNLVPRTVTEDPSLSRLRLSDGALVHARTFGDPALPALLVFHGGPGKDHRELLWLEALSDLRHVVLWDQRGAGLSERMPAARIGPRWLVDASEVASAVSPRRPVALLGYSWGGMFASWFLGAHPERVERAALIEPGALDQALFDASGVGAIDLAAGWLNQAQWSYDVLSTDQYARHDFQFAVAFLRRSDGGENAFWRFGAESLRSAIQHVLVPGYDLAGPLRSLRHPVLILAGDAPRGGRADLGAAFQRRQAARFGAAQVEAITGAGHDLIYTHRERLIERLRDFLRFPP